jgi:hypothetical protein
LATAVPVYATNNPEIDGLLAGVKWSGTITYSFPDSPSDYSANYQGDGEPTTPGFSAAPFAMQQAINYGVALISGYTNATIQFAGTNGADIAIAQSPAANPTSYAYYPDNSPAGGDVWFGTYDDYSQAALGNYYFTTAIHELGHAFGLKHSQETGGVANVAVPAAHDDLEYTVMSYRSYMGGSLQGGYTNEAYGFPQTYMANDILTLQTLYGANFTTHSEDTVYSWSPTTGQEFINGVAQLAPGNGVGGSANRIFETIWDGNGIDTYNLSNYTTGVSINLNPGASSITSTTQLAYLGDGHYAAGNIYNAYLYNNDARSYIDNAIGGSGNDTLIGNAIANLLNGGSGDDTFLGAGGNDYIAGGAGTDVAVFSGAHTDYLISYDSATLTFTVKDQRSGSPDGTDTLTGVENFLFTDGMFASSGLIPPAPDLIEYVAVSNTTVAAGGSTTVDAYALNLGNGISGPSTARIYLSTDATITTSDTVLATLNSGTLATVSQPGYYDHQTVSVTLPGNLAPGTYYIGGISDYNNAVSESNEANNPYNVVQITVPGPVPAAAPAATSSAAGELLAPSTGDSFVFAANLGKDTKEPPVSDSIQFDHGVATTVPDPAHGTAADIHITAPPDTGAAEMLQHYLQDFHLV